jgi:hypothetical protein
MKRLYIAGYFCWIGGAILTQMGVETKKEAERIAKGQKTALRDVMNQLVFGALYGPKLPEKVGKYGPCKHCPNQLACLNEPTYEVK